MRTLIQSLILTLFLLTCLISTSSSQNNVKYWDYRIRLNEQFLKIGNGQGFSIPAAYRNPAIDLIKWADATVDHGWYLGVLATENHLLANSSDYPDYDPGTVSFEQNTAELYYALKALQRLDLNAETSFILCLSLPSENGFFIRDDVPAGFHQHFDGMSAVLSDYVSINIYDKEMSQDQMYHILMGCALVSAMVDPDLEYNNENLVELAVSAATRIVHHVAIYSQWVIKNPACSNKVVDRGPDAWPFSKGTDEVIKFITDGAVNYDNNPVVLLNQGLWPSYGLATNPIHLNSDNTHMVMALASVGGSWGQATMQKLMNLATLQDFYLYPLLYGALYDQTDITGWNDYESRLDSITLAMLDEAPVDGPASPQPNPGTHGWGSNNRFIRKKADHVSGGGAGQQYNGLDYMLLYNLHYMVFGCRQAEFLQLPPEAECLVKTNIDLTPYGVPEGGAFSGPGVIGGNFFNPSEAGPGTHQLNYTWTDAECTTTATTEVTVDVCSGLIDHTSDIILDIYPNPTSESIFLEVNLPEPGYLCLDIVDLTGRSVKTLFEGQSVASQDFHLDLNALSLQTGIYLVRVSNKYEVSSTPIYLVH